jgi:hypothetical protein
MTKEMFNELITVAATNTMSGNGWHWGVFNRTNRNGVKIYYSVTVDEEFDEVRIVRARFYKDGTSMDDVITLNVA